MTSTVPDAPVSEYFHEGSESVRFWVRIDEALIGASVSQRTLHYRFSPMSTDDDPMVTFKANRSQLEFAVRQRVERGSIEPVMIREADLRSKA